MHVARCSIQLIVAPFNATCTGVMCTSTVHCALTRLSLNKTALGLPLSAGKSLSRHWDLGWITISASLSLHRLVRWRSAGGPLIKVGCLRARVARVEMTLSWMEQRLVIMQWWNTINVVIILKHNYTCNSHWSYVTMKVQPRMFPGSNFKGWN